MKFLLVFTFVFALGRCGILPEGQRLYGTPNQNFQQEIIGQDEFQQNSFINTNQIIDDSRGDNSVFTGGTGEVGSKGFVASSHDNEIGQESVSGTSDGLSDSGINFSGGNLFVGQNQFSNSRRIVGEGSGLSESSGSSNGIVGGSNDFSSGSGFISGGQKFSGGSGGVISEGSRGFTGDSSSVIDGSSGYSESSGGSSFSSGTEGLVSGGDLINSFSSGLGSTGGFIASSHGVQTHSGFEGAEPSRETSREAPNLQGSINAGSLFSNFAGGFSIPTPQAGSGNCETNYITRTVHITSSHAVPSTFFNEIVTTITRVATTSLIQPQTSVSTQTVVSTVFTTQFSTFTRTLFNTETSFTEVRQPAQTIFSTFTRTMISTSFKENTVFVTSTNFISTTIFSSQVIRTTLTQFTTRFVTNTVTQTLPGQTQFETQFQTNTQFVTQTIPGQTIINTRTIISTFINNVVSTLPAQRSTVFTTEIIPLVSTIFSTHFITQTQTQFVERTQFQTQVQSVYSTYYVTSTQYNEQVITSSSERIRTSVLTIPTQIVSTVESTRFQNQQQTRFATDTRRQLVTVTVPGAQIPVYQTTTIFNNVVSTSYFTNIVINTVTVTRTVPGNCGQFTQPGYNYNNPRQPFNF